MTDFHTPPAITSQTKLVKTHSQLVKPLDPITHSNAAPMDEPNGKQVDILSQMESVKLSDPKPEITVSKEQEDQVTNDGSKSTTPTGSKSRKSVSWSEDLVESRSLHSHSSSVGTDNNNNTGGSNNPYVAYTPAQSDPPAFNFKESVESVRGVLGRWGKKVGEATKKAEVLAGNTWQHLKTAPSFTDAALGRIAQGTKVLAEGGYEKIFRQTFDTVPEEQLQNSFACYLSTSAGPVMGVLYVSTAKLAFCSDNPLSYKAEDKMEWSYYKVVIPLHQLKAINSSTGRINSAEKYIQVISVDNHEFWYMGFLNYESAVQCLDEALEAAHNINSV